MVQFGFKTAQENQDGESQTDPLNVVIGHCNVVCNPALHQSIGCENENFSLD